MKDKPTIIFTPSGITEVPKGTSVLDAARSLGVDLDSVCGGRGICSKCQITPGKGEFQSLQLQLETMLYQNGMKLRKDIVKREALQKGED